MQDDGANDPHDGAEDEEADCEGGVVNSCLLGTVVSASPVGPEYSHADNHRDAGDAEQGNLGPCLLALSPDGKAVARWERFRGVKDGKRRGQHGEDDERTAEVDTAEEELGHADSGLDFLWGLLVRARSWNWSLGLQYLRHSAYPSSLLPSLELPLP